MEVEVIELLLKLIALEWKEWITNDIMPGGMDNGIDKKRNG